MSLSDVEYLLSFGLKNRYQIDHVDVILVFDAFVFIQIAGIGLYGEFVDARLQFIVCAQFDVRPPGKKLERRGREYGQGAALRSCL